MAQQVKVPDDLSWILGVSLNPVPNMAVGEHQLPKNVLLTFTNALWPTHAHPHAD